MSDQPENHIDAILEADNLVFAYDPNQPILNGASLQLYPGQCLGLAGANGSGKTTLFRCLTGLLGIQSGVIRLGSKPMRNEKDFQELRRAVGFVLQNSDDQILFPTVMEDLAFGPLNLGLNQKESLQRAAEALSLVGLTGFENHYTHKLSGGEKKLVAIASILAMRPRALLLDEPLNGLDDAACSRIGDLIKNLPCAKFIISHDKSFLDGICTDQLLLKNGQLEGI